MSNRTVIAFDFGSKSIGMAIGQEIIGSTHALPALKASHGSPDWRAIAKLIQEWRPDLIVVGLPLNIDGSEQPFTKQARKFANSLHNRFTVQVILHDERFSTVEARAQLFNLRGFRALSKSRIDSVSAVVILKSWFDRDQGHNNLTLRY